MDKEGDKVNEDARENHTLRNALLITSGVSGIIAGAAAGVKFIEKDLGVAKKYTKRATDKIIKAEQNTKKTTDKILHIDDGTNKHVNTGHRTGTSTSGAGTSSSTGTSTSGANIKKDPPIINDNNAANNAKTTAEKIKEQQKFLVVLMERFENEKNPALKAKVKEQIEAIKANIASYQLGNKK